MIFIEDKSTAMEVACRKKIITETAAIKEDSETKSVPMDVKASDYDGVHFHFRARGATPRQIEITIKSHCLGELYKFGAKALLDEEFGKYDPKFEDGAVTVTLDCDSLPDEPEAVVSKLANLKRSLYGAPFDQCFHALAAGESGLSPICYEYRNNGKVFLKPGEGNVAVVFQIEFEDKTDQELAKIILQEFADVQRAVPGSPKTMYQKDTPPAAAVAAAKASGVELGNTKGTYFLQMIINKNHVKTEEQRKRITGLLINIRTYILYHMKCTKAYMLARMRTKHEDLLQALNRARPLKKGDIGKKNREI